VLYSALNTRLVRIVHKAIEQRATSAPWPLWAPALRGLRDASDAVRQRALFRIPRVYRLSVRVVVFVTLMCDNFVLGASVGRLFEAEYEYATIVLLLTTLLDALVVVSATLLVGVCMDMENPFGSGPLDMPALSYVGSAAETSLHIMPVAMTTTPPHANARHDAGEQAYFGAMSALQEVYFSRPMFGPCTATADENHESEREAAENESAIDVDFDDGE
jgi:hypothetical protein